MKVKTSHVLIFLGLVMLCSPILIPMQLSGPLNMTFESGDLSEFSGVTVTENYGSVTVQSNLKHHGEYAGLATISVQKSWTQASVSKNLLSPQELIYVYAQLYLDEFSPEGGSMVRGLLGTYGQRVVVTIGVTSSRNLQLFYWNDTQYLYKVSATQLDMDAWVPLQIKVKVDLDGTGDGEVEVWANGVSVDDLEVTGLIGDSYNAQTKIAVGIISGYSIATTLAFDCVSVSSSYITTCPSSSKPEAFSVTIEPSSSTINVGETETCTATVSGGTSPYSYEWFINDVSQGVGELSYTTSTLSAGEYDVHVTVTDGSAQVATSNTATLTVQELPPEPPPPSATEVTIIISTTGGGTTDPLPGNYTYPRDDTITIKAIPDTGYDFSHWFFANGTKAEDQTLTLVTDDSYSLKAYFTKSEIDTTPPTEPELVSIALGMQIVGVGLIAAGVLYSRKTRGE